MDTLAYLGETQSHIHENIKFADQKATAFFAINSTVLASLFSADLFIYQNHSIELQVFSAITFAVLASAIFLASMVLKPRGVEMHREVENGECAIPEKIAAQTLSDFKERFHPNDSELEQKIVADMCSLVHVRSRVNDKKYEWLKRSIKMSFLAWALTVSLVLFSFAI